MWWPLTLTYIFKVVRPWLRKLCPLCSVYSSGWILFFIWHKCSLSIEGVSRVTFFSESENLNFWQIFEIFRPWPWKKKSTVLDRFFPYLAQIITSKRRCVAYNDLWPWPISFRSFGLGLENHVRSVASTVLDGFFPYLVQMVTSIRCVACHDLWPWPISSRSFDLDFENHVRSITFSVLDRLFPYLPQIITTIRGCVAGRWHRMIYLVFVSSQYSKKWQLQPF